MLTEEQKKLLAEAARIDKASTKDYKSFWESVGDKAKSAGRFLKQQVADTANLATLGLATDGWRALGLEPSEANQAMTNSLANAATLGAQGLYTRNAGAATDMLDQYMSGEGDRSFSDFAAMRQADRDRLRAEHPGASLVGGIAGSVIPATATAKALTNAAKGGSALAQAALRSWPNRIGTAAVGGAIENLAVSSGEGDVNGFDDAFRTAMLGAAGGAVGQGIGEAIPPVTRTIGEYIGPGYAKRRGLREAASSLMDPATGPGSVAAATGKTEGYSKDDLLSLLDYLDESADNPRMLGESNPKLLDATAALAGSPEVTGTTGPAAKIAKTRLAEAPRKLRDILTESLPDSNRAVTGNAAASATAADKEAAKQLYKNIFDSPEGKSVPIISKRDALSVIDADALNDSPSISKAYDYYKKLVEYPGGETQDFLTMKGLQNIKMELDKSIASAWSDNAASVDKVAVSKLIDLKNQVNDLMKSVSPDYAEAASKYAYDINRQELEDLGAKLIKGTNNTMPIDKVKDYVSGLSQEELGHLQDGALRWLTGQADQSPNFLKKLAAQNPDTTARLSLIFGNALDNNNTALDEVSSRIDDVLNTLPKYKKIVSADENAGKNILRETPDRTTLQGLTDRAAVLFSALSGHPTRGTLTTSARRVAAEPSRVLNQTLFDLLSATDSNKARTILDEIFKYGKKPEKSLTGGIVGSSIMSGLGGTK